MYSYINGFKCFNYKWLKPGIWIITAVIFPPYTINFDALIRPRRIGRKAFKKITITTDFRSFADNQPGI